MARRMTDKSWKFDWMRAVLQEPRFSAASVRVLMWVAITNVLNTEGTFNVTQKTIAENLGVTERTVRRAFAEAREFGFWELIEDRQRGPGHHQGDAYALVLPEQLPDESVRYLAELPDNPVRNDRTISSELPDNLVHENPSLPAESEPPRVLNRVLTRVYKELRTSADASVEENPARSDDNKIVDAEIVDHPPNAFEAVFNAVEKRNRKGDSDSWT